MKSFIFLLLAGITTAYSQKIPITTHSSKALEEYKLGFALEDRGQVAEAGIHYANAIKQDSSFALAHLALGMVQTNSTARRKHIASAIRHKNKVSAGEQLMIVGRDAVYGTGNENDEFPSFERLAAMHPEDEVAQYLLGYMHHHHGRKNFTRAIEHLEAAIRINPNYITPYNDLGYTYLEVRDFENAERIFKKYVELLPNVAAPLDGYADMLLRSGRYAESLKQYEVVIALDPSYPWAYFGKAGNLNFLNQHQQAREVLKPLLKMDFGERDTYHVWIAFECSFLDEGEPELAIDFLTKLYTEQLGKITFVQKYVLLTHIVRLCFEFDQEELGMKWYHSLNEFVQKESTSESTKKSVANLFHYYKARMEYNKSGKMKTGIEWLDGFAEAGAGKNDNYNYFLSLMLLNEKKPKEAIDVIELADQDNPFNQYLKARCLSAADQVGKAKELYEGIIKRNETQSVDYHLVRNKAIKELEKLVK